jgi:hypothetical protein
MAWIVRTYRCPECSHQWEKLQSSDDGSPKFCEECGADFRDAELEPVPSRIALGGSAIARSTDGMYRDLEETSAARAYALDAPHLKITDLKDNLRHGDVAAKMPSNTVTRFVEETKDNLGINYMQWGGGMAGARVAPTMPTGTPGQAFAGPGHMALAAIQPDHEQKVAESAANPQGRFVQGR